MGAPAQQPRCRREGRGAAHGRRGRTRVSPGATGSGDDRAVFGGEFGSAPTARSVAASPADTSVFDNGMGGGRGGSSSSSTTLGRRKIAPLERGIRSLLERFERRPPSPTKEQAAEWRDAVEFHVALSRMLGDAQSTGEEVTLSRLHGLTRSCKFCEAPHNAKCVAPHEGICLHKKRAGALDNYPWTFSEASGGRLVRISRSSAKLQEESPSCGRWITLR